MINKHKYSTPFKNCANIFRCLLVLLCVFVLSSCSKPPCFNLKGRLKALCELRTHGVPVIHVGQTVKIIFLSDHLFVNHTEEISDYYKPLLNEAIDFINTFSTIAVKVAAYSNSSFKNEKVKESIENELTRAQANSIIAYLKRHNLKTRLLYAVGKNGKDLISWQGAHNSRSLNRRVEITFRYYKNNTAWY